MTVFYSAEAQIAQTVPNLMASGAFSRGNLRRYRATITLASQTTSDTIVCAVVPQGESFAFGVISTDTSLGSSTVAIGITGTVAKYKAAATFTATDTPTFFGKTAQAGNVALTADETIFITIAAATMPASGTLVVDLYFSGT